MRHLYQMFTVALVSLYVAGAALAQSDSPQPSRNDPPPAPPNQTSKDPVPPGTDSSLPTRGGKQEPSSKVELTDPTAILVEGVLAVPGAERDSQTAPSKFSARTLAADQLPIAAYALRHLSAEQRADIYRSLHREMALSGELPHHAFVGAEVPPNVALAELTPVAAEIAARMPELRGLAFVRAGNKVLLVSPTQRVVLAVLE